MRILHFIYDHPGNPWVGGGGAARAWEVYRRLASRHDITVISGKYPGAADHERQGVRYKFIGTGKGNYILNTFCYAARVSNWLKEHAGEADVLVEDFSPYNPVFSFIKRKDAVLQLHQKEGLIHLRKYYALGLPFYIMERFYPGFFSHAIVLSEGLRQEFGLGDKAATIPNGFDPTFLTEESFDGGYVLFLGRLHIHQKGLDTLSAASKIEPTRLVIAGGGKDEQRVRQAFSGRRDVELTGHLNGTRKIYVLRGCSFVVLPSRYEGQPLTLVEAAACGKPVIVSDIPELRYAVDAGFGISFKTGDAEDLASKIKLLLGNEPMRKEMGNKARAYAKNYTWDKIAGEYEEFLLKVAHATLKKG